MKQTTYWIVWNVCLILAIFASLMGLSPLYVDEAGRELLKENQFMFGVVFLVISCGALALWVLAQHLEGRWLDVLRPL